MKNHYLGEKRTYRTYIICISDKKYLVILKFPLQNTKVNFPTLNNEDVNPPPSQSGTDQGLFNKYKRCFNQSESSLKSSTLVETVA